MQFTVLQTILSHIERTLRCMVVMSALGIGTFLPIIGIGCRL